MYQCTHGGNRGIWTASVYALQKWLEAWNTDPDIIILLASTIFYISGERNNLTQFPNLTLHSDILQIGWLSIILGFIPTSLVHTLQTYFTHTENKKTGLKWASQITTQIWKFINRQWINRSKFKHAREVLDNHTKELILDAEITYEHEQGQDTLPYRYNPYFGTYISTNFFLP